MKLQKVTLDCKPGLEFVEKLYLESFPRNERRPILEMHQLIATEDRFSLFTIQNQKEEQVGFISFWTFDSFIYLEHFAIDSKFRGKQYGKDVLEYFISNSDKPLVGEIEPAELSDMAHRRHGFYQRHGFKIWDIPYKQPPYEEGYPAIPMKLISFGEIDTTPVINEIYTKAYKIDYCANDC